MKRQRVKQSDLVKLFNKNPDPNSPTSGKIPKPIVITQAISKRAA